MFYKIISIILFGGLCVLGVSYVLEKRSNDQTQQQLNNEISKLQGVIKETETAYSARGVEIDNLKSQNKQLQKTIEKNKEEIVALGKAVLEWKDKYYKIVDAQGSVVDNNGNSTTIPDECKDQLKDKRFKVDFKQEKDGLEVSGFTLTNPPEALIRLHWIKPLTLDLILTKNDDDQFKVYIDPNDPTIVPTEINLTVDSSVFDRKWYEKFKAVAQLSVHKGVISSIGITYDVLDLFSIGPNVVFSYNGNETDILYGVTMSRYLFK